MGESTQLTHADFFSGIGGFSVGFERAGIRTAAFSEVDWFAISVLRTHWPRVPQLGCIVGLVEGRPHIDLRKNATFRCPPAGNDGGLGWLRVEQRGDEHSSGDVADDRGGEGISPAGDLPAQPDADVGEDRDGTAGSDTDEQRQSEPGRSARTDGDDWRRATVWTGGFPCQDLSVAGKRAGLHRPDGTPTRSGLAIAFLALVEQYRPRWIVLENVPGLFSSPREAPGRDLGTLLGRLGELGYGWAYRVLDARYFSLAQRRRRIFIVAGPSEERAAQVLFEPDGGGWDSEAGRQAWPGATDRFADGIGGAGPVGQAISAKWHKGASGPAGDEHHNLIVAEQATTLLSRAGGRAGRGMEDDHNLAVVGSVGTRNRFSEEENDKLVVDQPELAATLNSGGNDGGFRTEPGEHLIVSALGSVPGGADDNDAQANRLVPVFDGARSVAFRGRDGGAAAELGDDLANAVRTPAGGSSRGAVLLPGGEEANADRVRAIDGVPGRMEHPGERAVAYASSGRGWWGEDTQPGLRSVPQSQYESVVVEDVVGIGEDDAGEDVDAEPLVFQGHGTNVGPMGALRGGNGNTAGGVPFVADEGMAFHENQRAEINVSDTAYDLSVGGGKPGQGYPATFAPDAGDGEDDPLLPLGLDTARYKALGNAVAVPVAEWIARRLRAVIEEMDAAQE